MGSSNIIFENEFSLIMLEDGEGGKKLVRKINRSIENAADKRLRFRNEFAVTNGIDYDGVRKSIKLEDYNGLPSLLLEFIDGENVVDSFIKKSRSIEQIIDLFVHVVENFCVIHDHGIIHRDINPRNILIRNSDQRPVIIDFEKATKFDSQVNMFFSFEPGKNNLSYIAPEQTGRVNRRVDTRSDLYSLGITFFELFTEKLPYNSNDPLELIHFHLAKEIPHASHINIQVPEMLSRIIYKLMSKNAEDRYQTAQGVLADLKRCQLEYAKSRKVDIFELGSEDITGKLQIPQQLYGRYEEIKTMLKCFDRVCNGGSEMLFVSGYSGIGKTALISELYKPVTGKRAFYISGKYDQYQKNSPYFAIVGAITEFCNRLLTESKDNLEQWRSAMINSLNNQGKVLTDLIPSLEKIIGPQQEIDKLENQESQLRLRLVFQNFIKCISTAEHPLVLFCDDLQWADVESLNLMASLLTDRKIPYLLLIGAYRDNEVSAGHPLLTTIENLTLENAPLQKLALKPLTEEHIYQLIKDTLQSDDIDIQKLAELVFQKTQGNAFFIIEFLKSLHQNEDIRYDIISKKWSVNFESIQKQNITTNVVDLLISKLSKMEANTQMILSKAACIGNRFDLMLLSKILNQDISSLIKAIEEPMHENYIIPLNSGFEFAQKNEIIADEKVEFNFAHDRIQQACYLFLDDGSKSETHLEIAHYLEAKGGEDGLFDIAHHFNHASSLLTTEKDIQKILKLNLNAAKLASETGSFNTAQMYINYAQQFAKDDLWQSDYDTAYDLHKLNAELDYLNGKFEDSESRLQYALKNTKHPVQRSKLYFSLTQNHANQAHYEDAISTIREGLKELNFTFPYNEESGPLIPAELGTILAYFQEHGVESLKSLPFIENEEEKAIMLLLDNLSPNTYVAGQANLWTLHVLYKINFTIKHGWSYESFYAFTELGILLNILNMFDYAKSCTSLGFYMAELHQKGSMRHYGRSAHIHLNYGSTFFLSAKDIIKDYPKFYQICMENGEMVFAGYLSMYSILSQYYWGKEPLSKITTRIDDTIEFLGRIHHMLAYGSIQAFALTSSFLEKKTEDATPFDIEKLSSAKFHKIHEINAYALTMFYLQKADAMLMTGNLDQAFEAVTKIEPFSSIILGMALQDSMYRMISGLTYFDKNYVENDPALVEKIQVIRDQFALWENINPSTFRHKYHLLEAEWHSSQQEVKLALEHYNLALDGAISEEYNRDVAIIHMRIAAHWLREKNNTYALFHLDKAKDIFDELEYVRPFEHIVSVIKNIAPLYDTSQKSTKMKSGFTESMSYEMMDFKSIFKAANTLSEEIVYDNLIEKLLKIVNENLGGQRALLLTSQDDVWNITADYDINQNITLTLINKHLQNYADLPHSVIHFMTRSPQIINNSVESFYKLFQIDEYWKNKKYINFVALPLIHKAKLIGILYVENNIDGGTFSAERLETLSMLSSQMAVSLENANLYKRQSDLNMAYQKFVPKSFMETLGHKDILDVKLGDCIDEEMTVMFCDIRSYSSLSEGMSVEENFEFINSFLKAILPAITEYQGYINHFLGDGFIALFKSNPESAIEASNSMFKNLQVLNQKRLSENKSRIDFGIGLHTGKVMLGIIGDANRHDVNVLSDAVNLASRLETLNKTFKTGGIISNSTYEIVKSNPYFKFRHLGKVKVKGRKAGLDIYEILTIIEEEFSSKKIETLSTFEKGLECYYDKNFTEAAMNLKKVLDHNPTDMVAKKYLQNSAKLMVEGVEENWTGEDLID